MDELQKAQERLRVALDNPADDRYSIARETAAVKWLKNPRFCVSPSIDQYEEYKRTGKLPEFNPARHAGKGEPVDQGCYDCEVKFHLDLIEGKGFREDPWNIGKNIAAGVVNSIIPGSDLGDSWSEGQLVGGVIGGAASLFVNPAQIATKAGMNLGGVLGGILQTGNKIVSSGLGQLATNILQSQLTGAKRDNFSPVQNTQQYIPQVADPIYRSLPAIADATKQGQAGAAAFGINLPGGNQVSVEKPTDWKTVAMYVGGFVFLAFFGWVLFFKRKR